ncbi:hypothetical protein [Paenibacillus oleatilyticus]|uniref:hypothetical protein n=1 Tax=Paenibacillus oleatilyticus TaxID=2594886 RepID=UPI001C1FFEB1|nr:hypothetical protein [Paenibacillus oleatilyticus]MBU7316161.1 hypothetical protein [Paenibacillus oleatilyticus]
MKVKIQNFKIEGTPEEVHTFLNLLQNKKAISKAPNVSWYTTTCETLNWDIGTITN